MQTIGFIGTGTIAAAMVRGLKASGLRDRPVLLSPRNAAVAAGLAASLPGVTVAPDNQAVADGADLLVLAIRPQVAESVLRPLRLRPGRKVISLIAGLDHETIRGWTAGADMCRAIPLPFVADRSDAVPVYPSQPEALALFDALGEALAVTDRRQFDLYAALSALMGSYFGIAETAAEWAGRNDLPPAQARAYLGRLFANLGRVMQASPRDLTALRLDHSTPGGLNEQVFKDFVAAGGGVALAAALDRVLDRLTTHRRPRSHCNF